LGLIIALLVVAAAVCGCASGPAATPVPPGTPAGNATIGPSAGPGTLKSGSLFDLGKLKWYEYRITSLIEGNKPSVMDLRFDFTTSTLNGVTVKDDRVTMKTDSPRMTTIFDTYYDTATEKQVGGHMKMISNDITVTDQDIASVDDQYRSSDIAGTFAASDWPLAGQGTEAITVNGKAYTCTKYSVGNTGEYGMVWMSQGVPVPVKIDSKSAAEGESTWELLGWG
jgi:hypothetical protein